MLKLKKVAVTGGLSCGKSSVCRFFGELGAYVISADAIVHRLLSSDNNLVHKIIQLLGPEVYVNHTLDRSKIANKVFCHVTLLKALEAIIHPRVYEEIDREYQKLLHKTPQPSLFVVEVPLLFESDYKTNFDVTIAVVADEHVCMERFCKNTKQDRTEFEKRMARQLSPKEKAALADEVITNNGSLSDLLEQTTKLYHKLIEG